MPNDVHIKILQKMKKTTTTTTTVEDVCAIILNYDSINTPLLILKGTYCALEEENGSENTFLQLLLQKHSAVEIYGV